MRDWPQDVDDEVLVDLRATVHFALHGAGIISGDCNKTCSTDTQMMKDAVVRIEEDIVNASILRWEAR